MPMQEEKDEMPAKKDLILDLPTYHFCNSALVLQDKTFAAIAKISV